MRIVDLSHVIYEGMPVYSKDEAPSFEITHTLENDNYRMTKYQIFSHTGTHVDAPVHMLNNDIDLNSMKISHFLGKATIIDCSSCPDEHISLHCLYNYQERINNVDFIIIRTGWYQNWGKNCYFHNYPYLNTDAAEWLSSFQLQGIGIDTLSIDGSDSTGYPIHKIFLSKNILIIENLTNLDSIKDEYFLFCTFPLKIKDADASPVRAVAIEDIY